MREVQIVKWCDVCHLQHEDDENAPLTPATECWTIGITVGDTGRPVAKVLDVCEVHAKPIQDLVLLLGHVNQLPEPAPPQPVRPRQPQIVQPYNPCPVCGDKFQSSSMVKHIYNAHRHEDRPAQPTRCPECGDTTYNGTGMAAHRRGRHGFDPVAEALSGVKGYKAPKAPKAASADSQLALVNNTG